MLIRISNNKFCAWFNLSLHKEYVKKWPDIPPRLRVGSPIISAMSATLDFTAEDTFVYVGKKMLLSKDKTKRRQIRLILSKGQVGFIEGYDIKYFEPVS